MNVVIVSNTFSHGGTLLFRQAYVFAQRTARHFRIHLNLNNVRGLPLSSVELPWTTYVKLCVHNSIAAKNFSYKQDVRCSSDTHTPPSTVLPRFSDLYFVPLDGLQ